MSSVRKICVASALCAAASISNVSAILLKRAESGVLTQKEYVMLKRLSNPMFGQSLSEEQKEKLAEYESANAIAQAANPETQDDGNESISDCDEERVVAQNILAANNTGEPAEGPEASHDAEEREGSEAFNFTDPEYLRLQRIPDKFLSAEDCVKKTKWIAAKGAHEQAEELRRAQEEATATAAEAATAAMLADAAAAEALSERLVRELTEQESQVADEVEGVRKADEVKTEQLIGGFDNANGDADLSQALAASMAPPVPSASDAALMPGIVVGSGAAAVDDEEEEGLGPVQHAYNETEEEKRAIEESLREQQDGSEDEGSEYVYSSEEDDSAVSDGITSPSIAVH